MLHITRTKKELERFGLTENQSLIYILLVQHGELRIQEIVRRANIPRSTVYEIIDVLLEFGLVEKLIDQKFIKVRPYPIDVLKHILSEKIQNLEKLQSNIVNLNKSLTIKPTSESFGKTTIRYYKGVSGARQLFWNTLHANTTISVLSAYGRSRFVGKHFYMDFVKESRLQEIKEKVLINPTERALRFIQRDTGSPLARTKIDDIRILDKESLFIKGETFIYNNIYAQVYLDGEEINGFEVENVHFTDTQRSIFVTLWNLAKPLTLPY